MFHPRFRQFLTKSFTKLKPDAVFGRECRVKDERLQVRTGLFGPEDPMQTTSRTFESKRPGNRIVRRIPVCRGCPLRVSPEYRLGLGYWKRNMGLDWGV